jgi:hypothetical protein
MSEAAPAERRLQVGDALRAVAIAASVGAAAVHFAYAPSHFDEQTSHGVFFLVVAWAQVAVAVGLTAWRERPEPWLAAAAVNLGVFAVWLGSRTIGVPESHHDTIGYADALASSLEVAVVACTLVALRPALARRPAPAAAPLVGGLAALALVGGVSFAVNPSVSGEDGGAGGHAHGEEAATGGHADGHDAGGSHGAPARMVSADERCDLGFNTVVYNNTAQPGEVHAHDDDEPVDFTLEQWADVFIDPQSPITADMVVGYLEQNPVLGEGVLSGGLTHTLAPDPWQPMTDPAECEQLATELERAREIAVSFPTVATAEAAGYRKITNYYPGIAAHYINPDHVDDEFDLDHPEMLLFDGDGPNAGMVGLSYYLVTDGQEAPTAGFTGPNDHYHRHVGLCFRDGVVVAGSNASEEECAAEGGNQGDGLPGWMNHVWIVPGCESDWGMFSGANPSLRIRGIDNTSGVPPGCGTGRAVDAALSLDSGGEGPQL